MPAPTALGLNQASEEQVRVSTRGLERMVSETGQMLFVNRFADFCYDRHLLAQ